MLGLHVAARLRGSVALLKVTPFQQTVLPVHRTPAPDLRPLSAIPYSLFPIPYSLFATPSSPSMKPGTELHVFAPTENGLHPT